METRITNVSECRKIENAVRLFRENKNVIEKSLERNKK